MIGLLVLMSIPEDGSLTRIVAQGVIGLIILYMEGNIHVKIRIR